MSNEAAVILANKIAEISKSLDNFVKDLESKIKIREKAENKRMDSLRTALREVCTHEGATPIYKDERYEDYHHREERGEVYVYCSICGHREVSCQSNMKDKYNPFK